MPSQPNEVLTIATEQAAIDILSKLLNDEIDAENVEIDFSSATWAKFDLELTGSNFDTTINTDLMRALIEYQNSLYRLSSYVSGGSLNAAALTDDEREKVRLNFRIEEGSTKLNTSLVRALSEAFGKATTGMGPKQRLTLMLTAMLLFSGVWTLPGWLDKHYRAYEAEIASTERTARTAEETAIRKDEIELNRTVMANQAEVMRQLTENQRVLAQAIQQQPKLAEVQKQAESATNGIMRQAAEADTVQYHGIKLPGPTVRSLTGKRRRTGESTMLEGLFRVDAADSTGSSGFLCKIKRISDGLVIQATMLDALMSAHDQEVIQAAFWSKKTVRLNLTARKVGNDYRGAKITAAETVEVSNN